MNTENRIYFNNRRTIVVYKGHKYYRSIIKSTGCYYTCASKQKGACGAILIVEDSGFVRRGINDHNHPVMDHYQAIIEIELAQLTDDAVDDPQLDLQLAYHNIYDRLRFKYGQQQIARYWQTWNTIKGRLKRNRTKLKQILQQEYDSSNDNDSHTTIEYENWTENIASSFQVRDSTSQRAAVFSDRFCILILMSAFFILFFYRRFFSE